MQNLRDLHLFEAFQCDEMLAVLAQKCAIESLVIGGTTGVMPDAKRWMERLPTLRRLGVNYKADLIGSVLEQSLPPVLASLQFYGTSGRPSDRSKQMLAELPCLSLLHMGLWAFDLPSLRFFVKVNVLLLIADSFSGQRVLWR